MRNAVAWSWVALGAASLLLGQVLAASVIFIESFRTGLDADMAHMVAAMSLRDVFVGGLQIALFGAVFLTVAWWIAKAFGRSPILFVIAASAIPAGTVLILKGVFIVGWLMDDIRRNIAPLERDTLFYLPNYLEVICIGGAFAFSAWVFVTVSRALRRGADQFPGAAKTKRRI